MLSSCILLVTALITFQVAVSDGEVVGDAQFQRVHTFLEQMNQELDETATNVTRNMEVLSVEQQRRIDVVTANVSSKLEEVLLKLQERARVSRTNVGPCFQQVPGSASAIAVNLTQGAVQCVIDQVERARAIVTSLLSIISEVNSTLAEARTEWSNCQTLVSPWLVALCQGQVTTKLSIKAADYALRVSCLVNQAVTLISTAQQNVQVCVSSKLAMVPAQIINLIRELVNCIMGSISLTSL